MDSERRESKVSALALCSVLALIVGTVSLVVHITHLDNTVASSPPIIKTSTSTSQKLPCGSSPQHALHESCHFDVMSFSWLPEQCFDEDLINEFELIQDWHWYADAEGTKEVPKSQVLLGEAEGLFVSFAYHQAHCVFMWKKLHRAVENHRPIDGYIGNYSHTSHCSGILLTQVGNFSALNTKIFRKFPSCDL